MTVLHQQVHHPRFGAGTVTAQTATTISVDFPGQGPKGFLYPAAFQQFLTLTDPDQQAQMQQELDQIQAAAEAKRQEPADQEAARRTAERIAALTAKKKASAAKRTAAKKAAK